jgi:hypothetical protein
MAYRLRAGDTGPVQQSPVTCGSACLTVARMHVDPQFASWVRTGLPDPPGSPEGSTPGERFAAYERIVMRRTNSLLPGDRRLNVPWPRRFGTPPWGARRELEYGAARRGTEYTLDVLRTDSRRELVTSFDTLVDVVAEGEPGLLYVGNTVAPRHVVLVLPGDGDRMLDVYDPGVGPGQLTCGVTSSSSAQLALSGWDVPWFAVRPTGSALGAHSAYAVAPGAAPA